MGLVVAYTKHADSFSPVFEEAVLLTDRFVGVDLADLRIEMEAAGFEIPDETWATVEAEHPEGSCVDLRRLARSTGPDRDVGERPQYSFSSGESASSYHGRLRLHKEDIRIADARHDALQRWECIVCVEDEA